MIFHLITVLITYLSVKVLFIPPSTANSISQARCLHPQLPIIFAHSVECHHQLPFHLKPFHPMPSTPAIFQLSLYYFSTSTLLLFYHYFTPFLPSSHPRLQIHFLSPDLSAPYFHSRMSSLAIFPLSSPPVLRASLTPPPPPSPAALVSEQRRVQVVGGGVEPQVLGCLYPRKRCQHRCASLVFGTHRRSAQNRRGLCFSSLALSPPRPLSFLLSFYCHARSVHILPSVSYLFLLLSFLTLTLTLTLTL